MGKNDKVDYGEAVWPKLSSLHRRAVVWHKFWFASRVNRKTLTVMEEASRHPSVLRLSERLGIKVPTILLTQSTTRGTPEGYVPYTSEDPLAFAAYPNSIHSCLLTEMTPLENGQMPRRFRVAASDFTVWSVSRELLSHMFRAYLDRLVLEDEKSPYFASDRGGYRNTRPFLVALEHRNIYSPVSSASFRTVLAKKAFQDPESENVLQTLHSLARAWKAETEQTSYNSITNGDNRFWFIDAKRDIVLLEKEVKAGQCVGISLCQSGGEFFILRESEADPAKRLIYRSDNLLLATEEFYALDKRKEESKVV